MQDLNDKITGSTLTANEWDEIPSELQNIIQSVGITLSGGDLSQVAKAIALYSSSGNFYQNSGTINAYVLTPTGNRIAPPAYLDGGTFEFIVVSANTGAATANVAGLGAKNIVTESGNALTGGEISGRAIIKYNASEDNFRLVNNVSAGEFADLSQLVQQNEQNIQTNSNGISGLSNSINQINLETGRIRSTQGVSSGSTNLGSFPGTTIPSNTSVKGALTSLESALESLGGQQLPNITATSDYVQIPYSQNNAILIQWGQGFMVGETDSVTYARSFTNFYQATVSGKVANSDLDQALAYTSSNTTINCYTKSDEVGPWSFIAVGRRAI